MRMILILMCNVSLCLAFTSVTTDVFPYLTSVSHTCSDWCVMYVTLCLLRVLAPTSPSITPYLVCSFTVFYYIYLMYSFISYYDNVGLIGVWYDEQDGQYHSEDPQDHEESLVLVGPPEFISVPLQFDW